MDANLVSEDSEALLNELFESEQLGVRALVKKLFRYRRFPLVVDYLLSELYSRPTADIEALLFQISLLASESLDTQNFLLKKCSESPHFAVKTILFLNSRVLDEVLDDAPLKQEQNIAQKCIVYAAKGATAMNSTASRGNSTGSRRSSDSRNMKRDSTSKTGKKTLSLESYRTALGNRTSSEGRGPLHDGVEHIVSGMIDISLDEKSARRKSYVEDSVQFATVLSAASAGLPQLQSDEERRGYLEKTIHSLNKLLMKRIVSGRQRGHQRLDLMKPISVSYSDCQRTIHFPSTSGNEKPLRILRILTDKFQLLHSRERAPVVIWLEAMESTLESCYDENIYREDEFLTADMPNSELIRMNTEFSSEQIFGSPVADGKDSNCLRSCPKETIETSAVGKTDAAGQVRGDALEDVKCSAAELRALVFGKSWEIEQSEMSRVSPFGIFPGYRLVRVISKAGDDLRQEVFALQFVRCFKNIFNEEQLGSLGLTDYLVQCVTADSGIVEVVPDCVSIHSLKTMVSGFTSLLDYFVKLYGDLGSRSLEKAQMRFAESLAGYSLVCYFGTISDRHNGNILITADGALVHVDFGYMFANSPGAIEFEQAPFKFTAEYVEVLNGCSSQCYAYFVNLFVDGFLAARQHCDRILTLVQCIEGTNLPCVGDGEESISDSLREKFCLGESDEQCRRVAMELIESSRENWTTVKYDEYQFVTNGYMK
ncbi:hypothetical protein NDN08_002866 [Rhodosorus marinus]|uniref:1-phosphatidylinositol 4-kinase n=1 Tax=Rhodosorus marinus TaxID=101924 RepID=A0AAV8UXM2_9RHOD|nr:hypothetical protein NDN08_002866 [Rhodosorus marinus]